MKTIYVVLLKPVSPKIRVHNRFTTLIHRENIKKQRFCKIVTRGINQSKKENV